MHNRSLVVVTLALTLGAAAVHSRAADEDAVDHAAILRALDDDALQRGKATYDNVCAACHGLDGKTPTNPLARSFASAPMANGADPYALYKTLTVGFNTMPAQTWLEPAQRYEVIHYIREAFLKKDNPQQYTAVTDEYLKSLPKPKAGAGKTRGPVERDYGPVLGAQLNGPLRANNALHFRLPGDVAFSYDLHTMRSAGAWTDGFLDLSETHHYKQRGERMPRPGGQMIEGLQTYGWFYGDSYAVPSDAKCERGPLRNDLLRYHGHYLHADTAVLSYAVTGREVLEAVGVDRSPSLLALHHTFRVEPGDKPLRLAVAQLGPADSPAGVMPIGSAAPKAAAGPAAGQLALVTSKSLKAPVPDGKPRHVIADGEGAKLDLGTVDRTVVARFRTTRGGTLVASAPQQGDWAPDGKSLFVEDNGTLVYDIGWWAGIRSKAKVADGKWHTAALVVGEQATRVYIDGKLEAEKPAFRRNAQKGHVFKIGSTTPNFGGDFTGQIEWVNVYAKALTPEQVAAASDPSKVQAETLLSWKPAALATPADAAPQPAPSVFAAAAVVGDTDGLTWSIDPERRVVLTVPASDKPRVFRVVRSAGAGDEALARFNEYLRFSAANAKLTDPRDMTRGGPRRWPTAITVAGKLGEPVDGYALDLIPVPFDNPYNAWIRTSAVDFFPDGRAVVTTHGGDVWIVSGLDDKLAKVTWSRFAAGLFEPFGVKVVDGVVYVTTRDGIKRLHDYNGDGEADFVEAFHVDEDVSLSFHAYNFDLHTDAAGNFYFAKAGQFTDYDRPGGVMRVPASGGPADMVSWGLRTPNGMGKLPGDRFTVSDNQGAWMPAGKISLVSPGVDRFFGNMPNKNQQAWVLEHTGGKLPESFDEPIIWMPQELDNSCGGQVWADDKRWGPLAGRLIHSSFGKGWLYYLSLQEVDGFTQASIVKLPHQWDAGVMRLRVNPADGQVYGVGLSGWQGPAGGKDGCLQRLRYTGQPARIIESTRVTPLGIELTFNFPLDPAVAANPESYAAEMWDYLWSSRYGSDQFSVRHKGTKGHDGVRIAEAALAPDARTVLLKMPDLAVCDQLMLDLKLKDAAGADFTQRIYFTIHAIPKN